VNYTEQGFIAADKLRVMARQTHDAGHEGPAVLMLAAAVLIDLWQVDAEMFKARLAHVLIDIARAELKIINEGRKS
jgi:hypothetical protein